MIGVRCTSFFVLSDVLAGTWPNLVDGKSLSQLGFMKLFLASSHDRSSLHEFLSFFQDFFFKSFRSHVAQTRWVGEQRIMKLFFVSSYGRSSWTSFFFGKRELL